MEKEKQWSYALSMPSEMQSVCAVCGASDWFSLPALGAGAMTTAGMMVPAPLGKALCRRCGAVQKVFSARLADTDFYERRYTYYNRPGSEVLDTVRYRALADWVEAAVKPIIPTRILDVGCGRGSTISLLRERFPSAVCCGIEPSAEAVASARALGIDVIEGRLDQEAIGSRFDLIYSNNVLQHTSDPVDFLVRQKKLLMAGGVMILTCPDGTEPNIELLMADQNFSLRPIHLKAVAARAGLDVVRSLPCPDGPLRNEQLAVLRPTDFSTVVEFSGNVDIEAERDGLARYFTRWAGLDAVLCEATENAGRIFNFGGGLWSYVLAAYCPRYWSRVEYCLVDKFSGHCIDKKVLPFETVNVNVDDVLVLGTNPYVQQKLIARFAEAGLRAVAFNNLIPH